MMQQEYTLVVLAAGIGSRFGGGVKQLQQVGPSGEIIMDYSVYDAIHAGFNRILFIIRHDIEADFREIIGNRLESICTPRGIKIDYAFQELDDLPEGFTCPADRVKPWGTGHALLACRGMLDGPFVVINSDDYYGQNAFRDLYAYLRLLPEHQTGRYCLAGFSLGNTLSDFGGVTRGICMTDMEQNLRRIDETRNIIKTPGGARVRDGRALPVDACVSMNMWGFTADFLDILEYRFKRFLSTMIDVPNSEFLLPEIIDQLLAGGQVIVRVLPTSDQWFGMTYKEDVPLVKAAFQRLTYEGVYLPGLYL